MYNFDPYNVLLAIATNIPVLLIMTGFVLQAGSHMEWSFQLETTVNCIGTFYEFC